jgi:excisionase family DNA binding protein
VIPPWWETVGGRKLLTCEGSAAFARALRLAARYAAVIDGVDYRARQGAAEFDRRLAELDAAARVTADSQQSRTWRLVVPDSAEALTTRAAAQIIGVDTQTVRRMIGRGVLPARKTGQIWLVTEDDVRRLARDRGRRDLQVHRRSA